MSDSLFSSLWAILQQRKQAAPDSSYTATLYQAGQDKILKKLGEEAIETIIASKAGDQDALIHECADLWFHSLVLLSYHDIRPDSIIRELESRLGTSGLVEKASRTTNTEN